MSTVVFIFSCSFAPGRIISLCVLSEEEARLRYALDSVSQQVLEYKQKPTEFHHEIQASRTSRDAILEALEVLSLTLGRFHLIPNISLF